MVHRHLVVLLALFVIAVPVCAQDVPALDPTGAVSTDGIYTPPSVASLEGAFDGAKALSADPRITKWVVLAKAGQTDALLAAVEADLRSDKPHPFATHVWSWAQWRDGNLTAGKMPLLPAGLEATLGLATRAFALKQNDRDEELVALIPEILAAPKVDYWAAYAAFIAAVDLSYPQQAEAIARQVLKTFPTDFNMAWQVAPSAERDIVEMMKWLDANPDVKNAAAGRLLHWLMANRDDGDIDRLQAVQMWLEKSPADNNALRRIGFTELNLHRDEAALGAFRKAYEIYPFSSYQSILIGRVMLRMGDPAAAHKVASESAEFSEPPAQRNLVAAQRLSTMALDVGELGLARDTAMGGLELAPNDEKLLRILAQTQIKEGFQTEAIDVLRPLLKAQPADALIVQTMMNALGGADRNEEVVALFRAYREAGGKPTDHILDAVRGAYDSLGRHEEAAALATLAESEAPNAYWMLGKFASSLAKTERYGEAFERARGIAVLHPSSDWIVARVAEYGEKAGRLDDVREVLETLSERFPFSDQIWLERAKLAPEPAKVWAEASQKAPNSAFPARHWAESVRGKKFQNWQDSISILSKAVARLKNNGSPTSELVGLLNTRSWYFDEIVRRGVDPRRKHVDAGLYDLDHARGLGIQESLYWKNRYFLLWRLGSSPERSEAALKMADLLPDDKEIWEHLFLEGVAQHLPNSSAGFIAIERYIRRQPRNAERRINAAYRHNRYGGSPVVALAHLGEATRWNPNASVKTQRDIAYSLLGDHLRYVEETYTNADYISYSDRYVGWYEAARRKAYKDQPTLKSLDLHAMRVALIRPDGIEEERRYDPVTGRITFYRVGAATLQVEYTAEHNLAAVRVGSSKFVEFEYDDSATKFAKRNIIEMRSSDQPRMRFEYNDRGKPTVISIVDYGQVLVTYDETDEIKTTRAELFDKNAKDRGSHVVALKVTQAFQGMLSTIRVVNSISLDAFGTLPFEDEALNTLRERMYETEERSQRLKNQLELAAMLLEKVGDHPDHREEAEKLLGELYEQAAHAGGRSESNAEVIQQDIIRGIAAVRLWRKLNLKTRPDGLPRKVWHYWKEMRDWSLAQDETVPDIAAQMAALRAELLNGNLRALSNTGWLRQSPLSNPGFWRQYRLSSVLPKALVSGGRATDVLVRTNGDVIVGSNRGFAVLRRGYWEWFGFDRKAQRFSRSLDYGELDASSHVTGLAEDSMGRLWLGLKSGLAMIADDYELAPRIWRTGVGGLPSGGSSSISLAGDKLAIGGDGGLSVMKLADLTITAVDDRPVERLRRDRDGWLVMSRNGLWSLQRGEVVDLTEFRVTDSYFDESEERLYALQGDTLLAAPWTGESSLKEGLLPMPGQEAISATASPYGLGLLQIFDDETALGVFTDQGVAILRDGAFAHLSVPGSSRPMPVRTAAHLSGRTYLLTGDGVAAIERGQVQYANKGRVYDLLSDPALGLTYVAWGDGIDVVEHGKVDSGPLRFSGVRAKHLALDPDGALITHDGLTVLRFERGSASPQELFRARQTLPKKRRNASISHILAASDGSVWVTAGASVFHWRKGEKLLEFSVFKDTDAIEVKSDMLSHIFETVDGRILLVASNEGHRNYGRLNFKGGLAEYVDGKFAEVTDKVTGSWFLTGYTPIGDGRAIAGTASGFAVHDDGKLTEFDRRDDASYAALKERKPALYLGTRGARLGEDLWLFGSAGGVVGYRNGIWFDPDRLNWMLPRQEYANYGARTVHAVETDPTGRIYIGTDAGLTIYNPRGAGAEAFLISQQQSDFAFAAVEQKRMQEVKEILLEAMPTDSKGARLVETLKKAREKLAALEQRIADARNPDAAETDKLNRAALRARQKEIGLLAKLEKEEPLLFKMLQLNPLDLQAVGRKLPEGVTVAQYLPTKSVLYINLVKNTGSEVHQVEVDGAKLDFTARSVQKLLAAQARGTKSLPTLGLTARKANDTKKNGAAEDSSEKNDVLTEQLAWLYDQLLRPIEKSVSDETLILSPAGALNYVPYAALVRNTNGARPEYAIEHFKLAMAPSLYAIDMVLDATASYAGSHVVFGDPDGSLPGARAEAKEIAAVLKPDLVELRVGEHATYEELLSYASDARFVHLATHGKLDHRSPRNSFLLLAENRRMSIPQIMTLPLASTDLVFLSACETSVGADGLEYRTIAHAFAHAGVPSVIATLWKINDKATRKLALAFYDSRMAGNSNAAALAAAQKAMIEAEDANRLPGMWAGFTIFGKP